MSDTARLILEGQEYEFPVLTGAENEKAIDISKLRGTTGYITMDPGFKNTGSTQSGITYLDGENGILRYGGYPIEQLAEQSTFLEVAYLLLHGELPTSEQLAVWSHDITHHTFIHENMRKRFVDGFHYDAHPMGMFVSALAALGTFYDGAKDIDDPASRHKQVLRLIAKTPTIAAMCYRFSVGLPFNYPNNDISFPANFLSMMWKIGDDYQLDPVLKRQWTFCSFSMPITNKTAEPPRCELSVLQMLTRTPLLPRQQALYMARCTVERTKLSCAC